MTDHRPAADDAHALLRALLVEAGQAHHAAVGAIEDDWASWYATYLEGRLDPLVGFGPDAETIRGWLISADEQYGAGESAGDPWPIAYARLILDDYAPNHAP